MILITGGAYQGKTEYAQKKYNIDKIFDCEKEDITRLSNTECICNFQYAVKYYSEREIDPIEAVKKIIEKNPDIIIIMNEIGNGIVPIEKSERIWREQVGKTGCYLAENALEVIRIVCGCGVKIK